MKTEREKIEFPSQIDLQKLNITERHTNASVRTMRSAFTQD